VCKDYPVDLRTMGRKGELCRQWVAPAERRECGLAAGSDAIVQLSHGKKLLEMPHCLMLPPTSLATTLLTTHPIDHSCSSPIFLSNGVDTFSLVHHPPRRSTAQCSLPADGVLALYPPFLFSFASFSSSSPLPLMPPAPFWASTLARNTSKPRS